jgi:phosphate transport system permease protein
MHATASAGLSLSLRTLEAVGPAGSQFFPYVTVAQVDRGSSAADLGLARGDALLSVAGTVVARPSETWDAVGQAPGGLSTTVSIAWVPRVERVVGTLAAAPVPGAPGQFRVTVAGVTAGSAGERAGLQRDDVLLAADGIAISGTRQAWEAIVVAAREGDGPVRLTVDRGGEELDLLVEAAVHAQLPVRRDPVAAWWAFLTRLNEPRYPERAGLASALVGSLYVVLIMAVVAFPLAVGAAIYLEEYARQGIFTELIQVLVANLAGMPSAVVGIIGLAVLARGLGMGQTVLAGGMTLGLLVLPMAIVAAREALRTVPPSLREAAASVGATPWQVIRHHVLPSALPGILTGMILSLARALGDGASLLLLGAFLFVTFIPRGLQDSFTIVPLQGFDWATKPQDGFAEIAAAAIVVLLALLLVLNGVAIWLRGRYQQRWSG